MSSGFLYWSNICGCTSPTHSQTSPPIEGDDLSELARALRVLLTNRTEWNMDSIISIFDELTSKITNVPNTIDNTVYLL